MKIETIEIGNFGKLQDFRLRLNDGLNLLYGQNEDGKSTLMAFIKMMFYGSAGKSAELSRNPRKKYAPWDGRKMTGAVEFENKGVRYRVEKTFGASNRTDQIQLLNLATGEPERISSEEEIGQRFFGMGISAFEKSVFIGQIGSVISNSGDKEDEITQKLLNLVSAGDESISMKKVRGRLQDAKESFRSKSGRKGSLVELEQQLGTLRDERREALENEEEKGRLARQAEELTRREKEYKGELSQYSARSDQQQKLILMERLENVSGEMRDRGLKIGRLKSGNLAVDEDFLRDCRGRLDAIRTKEALLGEKTKRRETLEQEMAQMKSSPAEEIPEGYFEQVRNREKERNALRRQKEMLQSILDAQKERDALLEQKQKTAGPLPSGNAASGKSGKAAVLFLLAASFAVFLLSAVCGVLIHPAFFAGIAAAALLGAFAWKKRKKAAKGLKISEIQQNQIRDFFDQKISEAKKSLEEKKKEYEAAGFPSADTQDGSPLRSRWEALDAAEAKLGGEISRLLSQKNCKSSDELYGKQINWQSLLTRLNTKAADLVRAQNEETALKKKLEEEEKTLLQAVRPFAPVQTPEDTAKAAAQWEKALGEIRELTIKIDSQSGYLPGEAQGKSAEELGRLAHALRDELLMENGGVLPKKCSEIRAAEFKRLRDEFRNKQQECEKQLIEINGNIRHQFEGRKGVGEIDNEMNRIQKELEEQTSYCGSLDIALQVLDAAFQEISQSFGPMLNEKAAALFNGLTGGKYQKVTVSRNFDIQVQQAGDPVSHEWQYLSNGAVDQAYFSLRMAVSELLCKGSERLPLLLDDVFLQYDDQRTEKGLRFLADYAKNGDHPTQVLFFTCRRYLAEQLRRVDPQIPVLSLRQ